MAGLAATLSLPSVDDFPAVAVVTRLEGRRSGAQQVLFLAEGLVAGRDHAAAKPPGGEVGHLRHEGLSVLLLAEAPARSSSTCDTGHPMIFFGSGGA